MSDQQQIMYIRDGGVGERQMVVGTVADLAIEMQHREVADYEVSEVYGLDQVGDLKALRWEVRSSGYDEDDWADVEVIVYLPDGDRASAFYRVDGRS